MSTLYLIDTSALSRGRLDPQVQKILAAHLRDGVAATCATVDLEMGYAARNPSELRALHTIRQNSYRRLPIDDRVCRRAMNVQQFLADRGLHRAAGAMDLLTAAVAELHGATILHYDADFEHIASVTGQAQRWIVPRGSVD